MRLLTILFFFLFTHFGLQAQLEVGVGAGLGLDLKEVGVQARAQLGLSQKLRAAAAYSHFFVAENINASTIDANLHYRFTEGKFQPYALVGVSFYRLSTDILNGNVVSRNTGLNLGLGTQLAVGDQTKVFVEGQYTIDGTKLDLFGGVLFAL